MENKEPPSAPDVHLSRLLKDFKEDYSAFKEALVAHHAKDHSNAFRAEEDKRNQVPTSTEMYNLAALMKQAMGEDFISFTKECMRASSKNNPEAAKKHLGNMMSFYSRASQNNPQAAAIIYTDIERKKLEGKLADIIAEKRSKALGGGIGFGV